MYKFHYGVIKEKYGNNAKLLFTDTDSLCYHIKTKDLYEDFKEIKDLLDTSDFPKEHPLYDVKNKKIIGKFKLEENDKPIEEFIGLRSKMYSILQYQSQIHDSDKSKYKEIKKAKGVKKINRKRRIKT